MSLLLYGNVLWLGCQPCCLRVLRCQRCSAGPSACGQAPGLLVRDSPRLLLLLDRAASPTVLLPAHDACDLKLNPVSRSAGLSSAVHGVVMLAQEAVGEALAAGTCWTAGLPMPAACKGD